MPIEALVARANVGAGTDQLAVVSTPQGKAGAVALINEAGDLVDAAHPVPVSADRLESLIVLMARAVKMLESSAIVDSAQRQRIVIDAGTVTAVTTVTTVATVSAVTNVAANAGMDREQYINISKQTYAQGIRSRLTFA